MLRSRHQSGPIQSVCGRDSVVNAPLPPSATLPTYISSRSLLSSPCNQNSGPMWRRPSGGSSRNCFSTAAKSDAEERASEPAASATPATLNKTMVAAQETAVNAIAGVLMICLKAHHDSRQRAGDQYKSSGMRENQGKLQTSLKRARNDLETRQALGGCSSGMRAF